MNQLQVLLGKDEQGVNVRLLNATLITVKTNRKLKLVGISFIPALFCFIFIFYKQGNQSNFEPFENNYIYCMLCYDCFCIV